MDLATRKRLFNACDPFEPLSPTDPRNVDFDHLQGPPVRGLVWAEELASRIELSNEPTLELFTGLRGSGSPPSSAASRPGSPAPTACMP